MPLWIGSSLGAYEIVASIGAGGMGQVYRARDTRLKRDVALKVMLPAFVADRERLARFQREAEVLAALNHPHIAAIYGVEDSDGIRALVLELVEGETLADRLARGPIPLGEALATAKQIAEALESAHEQGIAHRDLKPANIKITPDGVVKVLDFGLAKLAQRHTRQFDQPTPATTGNTATTGVGVILGTPAYIAPEQATGGPADTRTDIWAFGCVLFEMLTGVQPFQQQTVPETLAAVLTRDPDLSALSPELNPRLVELIKRCLEKNPKRRWHAIGDVRAEIEIIAASPRAPAESPKRLAPLPFWRRVIPVVSAVIASAAVAASAGWMLARRSLPPPSIARFSLPLVERQEHSWPDIAISPDGTQVVYVANQQLYRRELADLATTPISGTETQEMLEDPVFSPDGRSIAFWSGSPQSGSIKRIPVSGGAAVTVCPADLPSGISWESGAIVFGQPGKGILRVSPSGGSPETLVTLRENEVAASPQILAGGEAIMFAVARFQSAREDGKDFDESEIAVWKQAHVVIQSLKSGERKTIIEGGFDGRYLPTGHLVYAAGPGPLLAVRFDLTRQEVTSAPVAVIPGVATTFSRAGASARFGVSDNGSLIYLSVPPSDSGWDLALLDRNGGMEPLGLRPESYEHPRISPDGQRVVFTYGGNVWVHDLAGTSAPLRISYGGNNQFPIWSPDGRRVAFQSDREGNGAIFSQLADGTGTAERLTNANPATSHIPQSWSPNGDLLLFKQQNSEDLFISSRWILSLRDKKVTLVAEDRGFGLSASATFSPDGRWIAYSPGVGIFVQPFPATGPPYQVSGYGNSPRWSSTGKEIFYLHQSQFLFVSVAVQPRFAFSNPSPAIRGERFEGRFVG